MRVVLLLCIATAMLSAQRGGGGADAVAHGADVFAQSCATGYCHGVKGTSGGAPRLASRGFDAAYITNVVRSGIQGTGMPAFGTTLNRADLAAVTAYVGSLNGIAPAALPALADRGMPRRQLPPEAQKGRALFYEAARGFGRCSTCHQVDGVGIAVADPIAKVPESVGALKGLASPHMSTATAAWVHISCAGVEQRRGEREAVRFHHVASGAADVRIEGREGDGWIELEALVSDVGV